LQESERNYPELDLKLRRHALVRILVDWQVTDLIKRTSDNIRRFNIVTLDAVRHSHQPIVSFSDSMQEKVGQLKGFLAEKMYHHPRLRAMSDEARVIIETLFHRYKEDPSHLHGKFKLRLGKEPVEIIIADFIAGMTDRYAIKMDEDPKL
jgi:dGTPase